jgi:hypothetical protein
MDRTIFPIFEHTNCSRHLAYIDDLRIRRNLNMVQIRDWLRKFPLLHQFIKNFYLNYCAVADVLNRLTHKRAIKLIAALPSFVPESAGTYKQRANLAVKAANEIFPLIIHLTDQTCSRSMPVPVLLETFVSNGDDQAAAELKCLFDNYGSDKSKRHNYHILYAKILKGRSATRLLEIGLGTNDTSVMSHMGPGGSPGASLRAFAQYLPKAMVYGADIDKKILFETDRIKTFFVDQTDPRTLLTLSEQLPNDFDLIIDDGLHCPNANIATLAFACNKLKRDGWVVIEDIGPLALPIWQVISVLLPKQYDSWILRARTSLVFVVRKREDMT